MLKNERIRILTESDKVGGLKTLGLPHRRVIPNNNGLRREKLLQGINDQVDALIHRQGKGLYDKVPAVTVNDESWKSI